MDVLKGRDRRRDVFAKQVVAPRASSAHLHVELTLTFPYM